MVCFSSGDSDSASSLLVQIFYEHGMQALVHHWQKYTANGGGYVEK